MTDLTNPIAERQRELGSVLAAYHEVTERLRLSHDQLSEQVSRLRDELEEKNRLLARKERLAVLGEMAAAVAHEIRTPLGSILLYTTLLEREMPEPSSSRSLAQKAMSGVRALEGIVRDILTFASPSDNRRSSHETFDLRGVILECEEMISALVSEKQVKLSCDLPNHAVILRADRSRLRRAVLNLLRNGIEAVSAGGRVSVRCRRNVNQECVEVAVADDGPGVQADLLERVFDPLFTTKDHGTGLGLAIVQRIITSHEGTVSVRKASLGGAEFIIRLPLSRREDVGGSCAVGDACAGPERITSFPLMPSGV